MAIAKAVSVDAELLAEARELAGQRGLSALINDALRVRLQHARVGRLLDDVTRGPSTVRNEILSYEKMEERRHEASKGSPLDIAMGSAMILLGASGMVFFIRLNRR